jgi:hypothetical protein
MISIPVPNTDRSLLTIEELRAAAGVPAGDTSQDASLIIVGDFVSAVITSACTLIKDGAVPPNLRLETIHETWRNRRRQQSLIMARLPVVEIVSVTECGSELDPADYRVSQGMLCRVWNGNSRGWWGEPLGGEIFAIYSAGYEIVPADLKYAAMRFVQVELAQGGRDPLLKMKRIEGVSEYQWWVDPTKDSIIPSDVMSILQMGGYINRIGSFA